MLTHPTLEKLRTLRLHGMADAYAEQTDNREAAVLSFDERLGLLVDREAIERDNRILKRRLTQAKLRQQATLEDVDYAASRRLDKRVLRSLAACDWIRGHENLILIGSTGTGKTYLACALAHRACLEGFTARYFRKGRLLQDLQIARGDGSYLKLMRTLAKTDLLVIDDWGLAALTDSNRRDLLELLDDRHGTRSTVVTSQIPVEKWHEAIGDPTLADAILDRLVHNAHRIEIGGESMRKRRSTITQSQELK